VLLVSVNFYRSPCRPRPNALKGATSDSLVQTNVLPCSPLFVAVFVRPLLTQFAADVVVSCISYEHSI